MKTLTIKREMVESLESDESKIDFANFVISSLTDREPTNGMTGEIFQEGLNHDLPEPLEGSPEFDSSNMCAAEYKRFSQIRAGYFPVSLSCGYADYKYEHWDAYSHEVLVDYLFNVGCMIRRNKGKKNFLVFLNYIRTVLGWHLDCIKKRG